MICYMESKSSGVFNFIGTFALKIMQQQPKSHYKNDATCDVTNET